MSRQDRYPSVRPYLTHAVLATLSVVLIPVALVMLLLAIADPNPPMLVIAAVGVLSALAVIVGGTALWMQRPDSAFISFSDLMITRWLQRRRAEKQLEEGTRLLGLDPTGQPVDQARVSPAEQLQVLKDLTAALEAKDPYTHGHSVRVERHAYRTAAAMGLSAQDIEDVRKAAALHDVGKIRVSDRILRKDGPLTIEERVMMEEHSVVGAWMVSSVGNADVIEAVRHHHEHWDGSGYPDGLAGTDIPLYARIIAVADAYDAINSTRPYRASCGRERAVEVLKAEAGVQFDPKVVECFLASLPTRLPIAAGLLVAFAGPSRLLRELFAWFRRFGAGSLTPAVGAAGAAVVLGASVFTPSLPGGVQRPAPQIAAADPVVEVDSSVSRSATRQAPQQRSAVVRRTQAEPNRLVAAADQAPADQVLGVRLDRQPPAAQQPPAVDADAVKPTPNNPQPDPQPEPKPDPQPEPKPEPKPEPQPQPQPEPEPSAQPEPKPDSTPEPHDGCPPGHEKAKGKGHQKHDDDANCG